MPRPSGARRITSTPAAAHPATSRSRSRTTDAASPPRTSRRSSGSGSRPSRRPRARPPLQRMRRPRAPRQGHRSLGRPGQRRFVRARPSVRAHRGGRVALRTKAVLRSGRVGQRHVEREGQAPGAVAFGEHVDEGAAILDDLAIDAHPRHLDALDDPGVAGIVGPELVTGDLEDAARRGRDAVEAARRGRRRAGRGCGARARGRSGVRAGRDRAVPARRTARAPLRAGPLPACGGGGPHAESVHIVPSAPAERSPFGPTGSGGNTRDLSVPETTTGLPASSDGHPTRPSQCSV